MIRKCSLVIAGLVWVLAVSPFAAASQSADQKALDAAPPAISCIDRLKTIAVQRDWWTAFVRADTLHLQEMTTPDFSLTLSGGQTYDRVAMLAQAATHTSGKGIQTSWSEEDARLLGSGVALVTSRMSESSGLSFYRYLTVLRKVGSEWQVTAAQSTREISSTPRVDLSLAGSLDDYEGKYSTPQGRTLQVVVRGSRLGLVEPSGLEITLEPIGPGLFEFDRISLSNGQVRMLFARDSTGKVTSISRLIVGATTTFRRIP